MSMAIKYHMMKKAKMAKGGMCAEGCDMLHEHMYADGGDVDDDMEPSPSPAPKAMDYEGTEANTGSSAATFRNRLKRPTTATIGYAEGGDVDERDLVAAIMHKRGNTPGAQANYTGPHVEFEDNQFDDLVKDDHLGTAADYTGANSGDELGNAQKEEDERDVVAAVMKSRRKKDRLPNPR